MRSSSWCQDAASQNMLATVVVAAAMADSMTCYMLVNGCQHNCIMHDVHDVHDVHDGHNSIPPPAVRGPGRGMDCHGYHELSSSPQHVIYGSITHGSEQVRTWHHQSSLVWLLADLVAWHHVMYRTKGLNPEELLVYQVIKQAGNTGRCQP